MWPFSAFTEINRKLDLIAKRQTETTLRIASIQGELLHIEGILLILSKESGNEEKLRQLSTALQSKTEELRKTVERVSHG